MRLPIIFAVAALALAGCNASQPSNASTQCRIPSIRRRQAASTLAPDQ
jgi:hypothetical protein